MGNLQMVHRNRCIFLKDIHRPEFSKEWQKYLRSVAIRMHQSCMHSVESRFSVLTKQQTAVVDAYYSTSRTLHMWMLFSKKLARPVDSASSSCRNFIARSILS